MGSGSLRFLWSETINRYCTIVTDVKVYRYTETFCARARAGPARVRASGVRGRAPGRGSLSLRRGLAADLLGVLRREE